MGRAGAGQLLADLLNELKQRSGYSYEQVGRKAHLSSSSVHRYCSGRSIPPSFGILEQLALACGADREETARLYRLWEQADSARQQTESSRPRRRRIRWLPILLALTALVGVGGYLVIPREPSPRISAPVWTNNPVQVPPEFVGVTLNTNTGLLPSFPVGSVRLWDSRTRWQNIERQPGKFDWTTLERLVTSANSARLPVLFTLGGTPAWASPAGPQTVYGDGSRASPPDNLAHWDRFVREVASRYRGRIGAYELWDLANHPKFFDGPVETLVEMVRRASRVIRSVDPEAVVVCPSVGQLWDAAGRRFLERFGALRGYEHCQAAAVKLHPRTAGDPPETMLTLVAEIDRTLHRAGAHPYLWSTGPSYDVPLHQPLETERAADHAVRFYLTGLYARYAHYTRMYFYSWGGSRLPIVLQPVGGQPTRAGQYTGELRRWLTGTRIHGCGQGEAARLPANLWQCRFDRGGREFLIWWTHEGTARMELPDPVQVRGLDGSGARVTGSLEVTERPVLVWLG